MAVDAVTLKGVCVELNGRSILRNVDAAFSYGGIHGITGHNGSGKSVMFKAILGLVRPSSGRILVNGVDWHARRAFAGGVGFLIEGPGFLGNLSGLDNLRYLSSLRARLDDGALGRAMSTVGLDPDERKPVRSYSLGMKQRLGIAQALMERHSVLILDEPFNGLDGQGVADMHRVILGERERGACVLLSSHAQSDIDALCDDVRELHAGGWAQE